MAGADPCKVVIVEDEAIIAADLKQRLEHAGYAVCRTADTGQLALQAIAETSPDLVVMDIRLKGDMDGIQVAERVRREFDLPVVYLTAYEDIETLQRVSQSQAFGYIKKPVASSSLRGSLQLALSKHRQERYLREQRDWFRASFAAVPDAVVVTDGLGRVTYLNPRAEQLTGCSVDAALGKQCGALLRFRYEQKGWPVEELPAVEDLVPAAMLEGASLALPPDICLPGPEGLTAIEGTVAPRWDEGRMAGAVIVFRDAGPRQLAADRKLEENKQEALVRLAAGISSRLDLEVGVLTEESATLIHHLPPGSALRREAETVQMAALDVLEVSKRLESFTRPKGIQIQQVHVNELLASLEHTWKGTVPGLCVRLGALPEPVEADAYQLTRVLTLVLQHALESMKPGTRLGIETSQAELLDSGTWVRIRFAYAGFGEDGRMLERAFEPSWTGPREGLPVAYELLRAMGGFLTAGFERGTTVVWEVYLRPSAARTEMASARPAVLWIEPNARVGRLLQQHFERHGFNVFCVTNCEEARVAAELYQDRLSLAIANLPEDDPGRAGLETTLACLRPGFPLRWMDGYREACVAQPGSPPWRFLTKADLLQWARSTIAAAPVTTPAVDRTAALRLTGN